MADQFTSLEDWEGAESAPIDTEAEGVESENEGAATSDRVADFLERMRTGQLTKEDDQARVEGRLGDSE